MREQNPPKSKEEAEQQRLAAIGRAKFQRIHGRQQKKDGCKDGGTAGQPGNAAATAAAAATAVLAAIPADPVAMAAASCLLGAATKWVPHPPSLGPLASWKRTKHAANILRDAGFAAPAWDTLDPHIRPTQPPPEGSRRIPTRAATPRHPSPLRHYISRSALKITNPYHSFEDYVDDAAVLDETGDIIIKYIANVITD